MDNTIGANYRKKQALGYYGKFMLPNFKCLSNESNLKRKAQLWIESWEEYVESGPEWVRAIEKNLNQVAKPLPKKNNKQHGIANRIVGEEI